MRPPPWLHPPEGPYSYMAQTGMYLPRCCNARVEGYRVYCSIPDLTQCLARARPIYSLSQLSLAGLARDVSRGQAAPPFGVYHPAITLSLSPRVGIFCNSPAARLTTSRRCGRRHPLSVISLPRVYAVHSPDYAGMFCTRAAPGTRTRLLPYKIMSMLKTNKSEVITLPVY